MYPITRRIRVFFARRLIVALLVLLALPAVQPAFAAPVFTVNTTIDANDIKVGDGICDASASPGQLCSLRAALQEAAGASGTTINFNIPGTGVQTIKLTSGLPGIIGPLTINGYSQPGSSPNTASQGTNAVLKIELSGANAGQSDGLSTISDFSGVVIKGLVINNFQGAGIRIGTNTLSKSTNHRIEGNFIGTDASGTQPRPNHDGVRVFVGSNNTIGGTSLAARNLISGNTNTGIRLDEGSSATKVQGNLIGTKKDGSTGLGNGSDGVHARTQQGTNTVGGTSSDAANTIAFNKGNGVTVVGDLVLGASSTHTMITRNAIFSNSTLGIDLRIGRDASAVTPNDVGDADSGGNEFQNFPLLSSVVTASGTTTIKGALNSSASKSFTLHFYASPDGGQGKTFIGQKSVTTDSAGNVSFTFTPSSSVKGGQNITATATDASGNTSEFSAAMVVVAI